MERPTGVTVIAVLLWLVGAVNVISGMNNVNDVSAFWGGTQVVTGLAVFACGIGCWQMHGWARIGTIVLMALNAIGLIGIWVQYSDRIIVSRVLWPLVVNVVVVLYLLQPRVKEAFAGRSPATA